MITVNIRGLLIKKDKSKMEQLRILSQMYNSIIMIITESWLSNDISDAEVRIPNYNIYRADRSNRIRGGTCLYLRKDIAALMVLSFSNSVVEIICVKIPIIDTVIAGIYRPPNASISEWNDGMEKLISTIDTLQIDGKYQNIIWGGDFNLKDINWNNFNGGNMDFSDQNSNHTSILFKATNQYMMNQTVFSPTRNNNILDLIFTNNQNMITEHNMIMNSNFSDHNTIISKLNIKLNQSHKNEKFINIHDTKIPMFKIKDVPDYHWENYSDLINTYIWSEQSSKCNDIEDRIKLLLDTILMSIEQCFENLCQKKNGNRIPKHIRKCFKKDQNYQKN